VVDHLFADARLAALYDTLCEGRRDFGFWHEVQGPVTGDLVRFTTTFTSPGWERSEVSHSTLRFLDVDRLASFLAGAGLAVDEQYGDWGRQPLTGASPEIITLARPE
jgi:hypothetical protein